MQDQIDLEAELSTPDLSARDLRDLAGLSYRQVNQWDERDFLPHQRAGSKGWRRVSGWDAIAVTIMASLRDRLGVSLQKQRGLFQWMTGRAQTIEDIIRIAQAEDMACELPNDGWAAGQWDDFMERFLKISMSGVSGVEVEHQIQELLRIAAHAPDAKALHAVQRLATGVESPHPSPARSTISAVPRAGSTTRNPGPRHARRCSRGPAHGQSLGSPGS